MKITLETSNYEVIKNYKNAFQKEELDQKYTEYFEEFDYIFGDYAYDKLRLKGFYEDTHQKAMEINQIGKLDSYIKNYCAYECRYFLLKKLK